MRWQELELETKTMALVTVDGVYENGRVKLVRKPAGVKRAKVTVTFLPDDQMEALHDDRLQSTVSDQTEDQTNSDETDGRDFSQIRIEYGNLIHKKLRGTLSREESERLDEVRRAINRLDRASESWLAWDKRAEDVEQRLIAIQSELESFPDA